MQATSEADERKACWVGSYSQSSTMPQGTKEISVSHFYFCGDLGSASLVMKQPEEEETAQGKGHQQVWFCALGKSWSKVGLDPNCAAHCVSTVASSL